MFAIMLSLFHSSRQSFRSRVALHAETEHPTSEWAAHQLLEAFRWESASPHLLHDRDRRYGEKFSEAARWLGISEVLTAPQSPWKNAYIERLIGSVRRESLDHVIVLNATPTVLSLLFTFDCFQ